MSLLKKISMNPLKSLCFLLVLSATLTTACKRAEPHMDQIPDATVSYTITGDETVTLSFTLPEGTAGTYATVGSYVSVNDLMSLTFQELNVNNLSIFANTGGVRTGSFPLNEGVADFAAYSVPNAGIAYMSTSGSLKIDKAELFQNLGSAIGGGDTYYIEGSFTAEMTDSGSPAKTIEVNGTFQGIPVTAR